MTAGQSAYSQVWYTETSGYWVLGIVTGGRQLNTTYMPTVGTYSGPVVFDLYGESSGWFKEGRTSAST